MKNSFHSVNNCGIFFDQSKTFCIFFCQDVEKKLILLKKTLENRTKQCIYFY